MTTPAPSGCCPCPPAGSAAGFLLCDCPPVGDCVQFIRVYTAGGGFVDTTLDRLPYVPTGTVGSCCDPNEDAACASLTTPVAVAHLCLEDGTPIVVVVQRDCDGTVSAPGWVDLTTGVFTAGLVPADAAPCDSSVDTAGSVGRLAMCDVQGDGTVVGFLRAIDAEGNITNTTIAGLPYVPTGTVGLCEAITAEAAAGTPPCASPTTPVSTIGLCLADGTPIAVTAERDCAGVVVRTGWLNLATGTWSAGAAPAGTRACGETAAFDVSGVLCDVDPGTGDVLGLVLIQVERGPDGEVTGVTLINAADGTVYVLVGELSVCPTGTEQPEKDLVVLCDVAVDGTATPFIRDYTRDENGAIVGTTNYTLAGAPYAPAGTVGVCPDPEVPATGCETLVLCDAPILPTSVVPITGTAVAVQPFQHISGNPQDGTLATSQQIWDGEDTTVPASTPNPAGFGAHTHYAAQLAAGTPECGVLDPAGSADITVSLTATNDGPGGACLLYGRLSLWNGAALVTQQQFNAAPPPTLPAGGSISPTMTGTVPVAALQGGTITVEFDLETGGDGGCGQPATDVKAWTVTDAAITGTAAVTDCTDAPGTPFLRTLCRDRAGAVTVTDTQFDGTTPYAPVGVVGDCAAETEPCSQCQSFVLCDAGAASPALITGLAPSGTLPNGVDWSALDRNPGAANGTALPPEQSNGDGTWWGLNVFPHATRVLTEWTFAGPSTVEFSVYLNFNPTGGTTNQVLLPPGLEVVSLPAGYDYNAATGVLTKTEDTGDPCSSVTDPAIATSARFRTPGPVTSLMVDPRQLERIALCGGFFTYLIGAFQVTAAGQFLRTICRDCTGAVASVMDTLLDGTTPYDLIGEAIDCGGLAMDSGGSPEPAATVVSAHHFEVVPGTPWTPAVIPPGQTLTGLSVTGLAGTFTVVDSDGTSVAALPAGFTESWSAIESQDSLIGPTSVTAAAGSRVIVTMSTK